MAWDWDFIDRGKLSTSEKVYSGIQLVISIAMIGVSIKKNLIFISFNLFQVGSAYYNLKDCDATK